MESGRCAAADDGPEVVHAEPGVRLVEPGEHLDVEPGEPGDGRRDLLGASLQDDPLDRLGIEFAARDPFHDVPERVGLGDTGLLGEGDELWDPVGPVGRVELRCLGNGVPSDRRHPVEELGGVPAGGLQDAGEEPHAQVRDPARVLGAVELQEAVQPAVEGPRVEVARSHSAQQLLVDLLCRSGCGDLAFDMILVAGDEVGRVVARWSRSAAVDGDRDRHGNPPGQGGVDSAIAPPNGRHRATGCGLNVTLTTGAVKFDGRGVRRAIVSASRRSGD